VAFASFLVQRRLQLRREDLIAANMTLFKLRAMQRKSLLLRKMVRYEVATKVQEYGNVPTWGAVRPLLMSFERDSPICGAPLKYSRTWLKKRST